MIIPVRCFNCGLPLADKWDYYEKQVAYWRQQPQFKDKGFGSGPIMIDGTSKPDTPERKVCDELGITEYCCRMILLTHRDLIEKI